MALFLSRKLYSFFNGRLKAGGNKMVKMIILVAALAIVVVSYRQYARELKV